MPNQRPLFTNFIWYIFLDYYSGEVGGVCNNENDVIREKAECTKALLELDFKTSGNYWTTSGWAIPSGCSIRNGGDKKPHFLKSDPGVGTGRNDLIPLCKNVANIGISFIFDYQICMTQE